MIDCRYGYEYEGGKIEGAVNFNSKSDIKKFFKANYKMDCSRIAIIFYCEFSKHRGPQSCQYLRSLDRANNVYPRLSFPELYMMQGGYKKFYESSPQLCTPQGYVSMWDPKYSEECKNETLRNRRSWAGKGGRGGKHIRKRRMRNAMRQHMNDEESRTCAAHTTLKRALSVCLADDVTRSSSF